MPRVRSRIRTRVKQRAPFDLTKPCTNCPFRSDVVPYLTEERVREIQGSLDTATFDCHKTLQREDSDEDGYNRKGCEAHCAGALILLEKSGKPSRMMQIGGRLGLYDHSRLDMTAPVFDSFDDMAKAQPFRQRGKPARIKP